MAALPIPAGVTVREVWEPRPDHNRPRNVLERAALCEDRAEAIRTVSAALGLTDDRLARASLSEPYRWARFSEAGRLTEIANWIRAECFEVMDLVRAPVIDTLGD